MAEFSDIIKRQDDSYIFIKPIGEVRIPIEYLEQSKRLASFTGELVETFGIFYLYYWNSLEDKENGKKPGQILVNIQSMITMEPSYKIQKGAEYILEFHAGDVFIKSILLVQTIENQKRVINMLFNRYIPDFIGYSDIFKTWESCKNINKINLKSPSSLLELIVSEMCRNPENLNQSFRMYLKKYPDGDEKLRVLVNLLDLPKYLSTFGSLSSANPTHGATKSVTRTRKNEADEISPVEEAIK